MKTPGKKAKTVIALLVGAKTLLQTFNVAAQPPVAADTVSQFMGVPYVEINQDRIAQSAKPEFKASDARTLTGYKTAFRRGELNGALKALHLEHTDVGAQNLQKLDKGTLFDGYYALLDEGPDARAGGVIITQSMDTLRKDIEGGEWGKHLLPGMAPMKMTAQDEHELARFHELAHVAVAGLNEPLADQIGALLFLRAHPDKRHVVEISHDRRQLQTLLLNGHFYGEYGMASVHGLEDVLRLPQESINKMTDVDIRDYARDSRFALSEQGVHGYNDAHGAAAAVTRFVLGQRDGDFLDKDAHIRTDSRTMQNLPAALEDAREDVAKMGMDMKAYDAMRASISRLYKGDYQAKVSASFTPAYKAAAQPPRQP